MSAPAASLPATHRYPLGRRPLLAGLSALALGTGAGLWPIGTRAAVDRLTLYGAPIGVSLPLAHLVEHDLLRPVVGQTALHIWRSPDEMRAGVAAGDIELTTSPAPTAANLYNRGTGMRLAAVLTTGMLYLMTTDDGIVSPADLAGRPVLVPFRGDMPDRVLRLLLDAEGLSLDDVTVEYTATPLEAAQLLLAGRAPAAVLQEPAATAAILRGRANGVRVRRAVNLQEAFAAATGRSADIPMAVLIIRDSLRRRAEGLTERLVDELRSSTAWVIENPAAAAALGESAMGLRASVLEQAIPHMNLTVRRPTEVREHLSFFYELLASDSAALLGGRLPDAGFYLDIGAPT